MVQIEQAGLCGRAVPLPHTVLRMPLQALALTSHFLLRTIEVGALCKQHVVIRPPSEPGSPDARGSITVTIVSSKMDYKAAGFRIKHSCVCASPCCPPAHTLVCPYHLALDYSLAVHGSPGPW